MVEPISNLDCHYFCRTLLGNLTHGVYFVDIDGKIIYWNYSAEKITGFKAEEVLGKSCSDNILVHINEQGENCCGKPSLCPIANVRNTRAIYEGDLYMRHRDGYRVLIHIKTIPVLDDNQNLAGIVEIFHDNAEMDGLNSKVKELEKMALLDSLTKIANRRYIEMQLRSRLNEFKRFGWQFGILFIDIDLFKNVNDQYGHQVGDNVLRMIASILAKNSRSFDLVGRWGGEEFIVIVPNVIETQLYTIAHKYKNLIALSNLKLNSEQIGVTVSVGATLSQPKDTFKSIIKRADRLMYQSKKNGRNRITADFEIT